ncbi:hypothetical protein QN277_020052 [Acacia crassicarpa]|uniref:non-specific serine/threonine protein kinase n=1 Tax=Acacia crassicarpa TaxID=499986 RepID=A0AAE1JIR2_9FABA|nr:hypothetical protein QN277_020052 [Acacia crassicarpa]
MASSHSHIGLHTQPSFFFFILLLQTIIIPLVNPISFNFNNGFKNGDLKLDGEAQVTRSEIQVTANSRDRIYKNSVGRVTWHRPVRLWDATSPSKTLTDFSTTFTFVVYSDQFPFADGLAFFLADPDLPPLTNITQGGGLGIIDGDQVLNSTTHPFVAVEFDTWHNSWDPDWVHVGININSMQSVQTKPWFSHIYKETKTQNCSVKYDSSTLELTVAFTAGNNRTGGDSSEINSFSYKVDLRDYLPEKVILGFSAATGGLFEVHTLQSWSFNSTLEEEEEKEKEEDSDSDSKPQNRRKILFYVGLGSVIGLSFTCLSIICVLLWRRSIKAGKESSKAISKGLVYDIHKIDEEFNKGTGPKSFCYNALKAATRNFLESRKLGQGGFGAVYKGYLKELSCHVAIKRISSNSAQGVREYSTEVKIISQLRHRNLVQLLGWCHKKNDLLLVYEYMPNGSLDSYLCNDNDNKPKPIKLTWQVRYNIALGLASALLYLHEEWSECVLHRDIKPSNVLLDSNFNAKLGDFGLARLVSHERGCRTTLIAGTRGYIAPEYAFTGKIYKESDIYSFGVVLLEVATGRRAVDDVQEKEATGISVAEWVWELYGKGKVGEAGDSSLVGEYKEEEMERMLVVGLWCTHPEYKMRPNLREVIKVLKFEADLPEIPLVMPVPVYLPPAFKAMFSSVEASFWAKCSGP